MPPFVPPPNPPAEIQTVVSPTQRKQLNNLVNSQGQPMEITQQRTLLTQFPSETQNIPLVAPTSQDVKTTPPEVVEFYLSSPEELSNQDLTPSLPSTGQSADLLGAPITTGTSRNKQFSPRISQDEPVISEIRALNGQAPQASRLLLKPRDTQAQPSELLISPSPSFAQGAVDSPNSVPQETLSVVELVSDRQEYDAEREVVYAEGKVIMRFANGVLLADRLWINLPDQFAVAEGNVVLDRGEQTLRGERFEYYFVQDSGVIFEANGEIYQPTTGQDFSPTLPTSVDNNLIPNQTLNERLAQQQPLQRITSAQGITYSFGVSFGQENIQNIGGNTGQGSGGQINRIRFEADRIEFDAEGWRATDARLTNDPFSPPEVEVRAETATYRNIAPLVDEVKLTNSRVVLDQTTSFPTQDRLIFDRRERQPGVIGFGYDDRDRGGFFVERGFNVIDTNTFSWQITPQYYLQKGIDPEGLTVDDPNTDLFEEDKDEIDAISPPTFGFINELNANLSPQTTFFSRTSLTSLEFSDIEDRVRTKTFLQYRFGEAEPLSNHDLRLEYNYRERLFNGSLGFQTVRSSIGLLLVSPQIPIDDTGLQLSYQGSLQTVNAFTDRPSLLGTDSDDRRVSLTRVQGAASLNKPFLLWYGQALPPTPEEGLKYTSTPVLPYLVLSTGVTGVTSLYGNGDSQPSISGTIGLSGQLGNFSRPFLDYTGFNISFSQALRGDPSPFLFDRFADLKTLNWGITQQLYGPVRVGVQSAYNIDTDEEINTDLFVEYSRRTYSILLRYNTVLKVGSLSLRISDFNWGGNPGPFDGTGIRPVIQGIPR
ncbi:unknown [Crocosphaera subtropica ATCC 51142]|uniref:Organic solvent tolerance-like N-terminal domain-containing protein n=1 Tax=Crocosphaera subtropica (strain ATCC 51142 / BH68) TaxID=43989 RepID=B1WYX7_CROS5|nr:DUF3769 domain-containing protein [Crocosphaera subtropica]ACB52741.1 unknown [Crocosphaera subtropica ATCC 51142]